MIEHRVVITKRIAKKINQLEKQETDLIGMDALFWDREWFAYKNDSLQAVPFGRIEWDDEFTEWMKKEYPEVFI